MATNSIYNYIRNVTTSVKYAAIDKFQELAPAPAEFVQTNADIFKEIRDTANSMRTNYRKIGNQIKKSKIYDTADVIIQNVFSDIRTGKFYNKERIEKASAEALGFDDMSDNTDSDWMNESWNLDDDSEYLGGMIDQVGAKSTNAVCRTIAATSDAISHNIKGSTQLLYTQSVQMHRVLETGLSSISDNTGKLLQFSNDVIRTHVDNSTKFYQTSTDIQTKQLDILQKIYEEVKTDKKPQSYSKNNDVLSYNKIASGGIVDIREYIKLIKKNASNRSGGMLDMLSMFGDPLKMIQTLGASPLQIPLQAAMGMLVNSNSKRIFEEFNNTFNGLFGSFIMKANKLSTSSNSEILRNISDMLGIKTSLKKDLSTSNYEKGSIRWNGKANKALVEVIPTYLAKIEAALTGGTTRLYDYESGRFIDAKDIKKQNDDRLRSRAFSSTSEMRSHFNSESRYIQFGTVKEQEQFRKDIDNFFVALFEKGQIFDFNQKNIDNKFSQYGVSSKNNFIMIKNMFMNSPIGMQMMINNNILAGRDSYNRMMADLENQGTDISMYAFNNSGIFGDNIISDTRNKLGKLLSLEKTYTDKNSAKYKDLIKEMDRLRETLIRNKKSTDRDRTKDNIFNKFIDDKGHNIFYYLQNILYAVGGNTNVTNSTRYSPTPADKIDEDLLSYERRRDRRANSELFASNLRNRSNDKTGHHYISSNDALNIENYAANRKIREEDLKKEEAKNKYSYLNLYGVNDVRTLSLQEKLKRSSGVLDSIRVIMSTASEYASKPLDTFMTLIEKTDSKLYKFFYGKEITVKDGTKVEGMLGLMSYHFENTFTEIKDWFSHTFSDLFENIFKTKDGQPRFKFNFKNIIGDNVGKFFKEMGSSISSYVKGAAASTAKIISDNMEKAGLSTKSIKNTNELTFRGKNLRKFYKDEGIILVDEKGREISLDSLSDEELARYAYNHKSDFENIIYSADDSEKKNLNIELRRIQKYSKNKNKYINLATNQFTNLNKQVGLNYEDNKKFQQEIEDYFKQMSLSDIGSNEREVKKNILKENSISLEALFGRILTDSDGKKYHDKNDPNRIIKDQVLYNKYMEFMKNTGFDTLIGDSEKYTLVELFQQQKDVGGVVTDTLQSLLDESERLTEQSRVMKEQSSSYQTKTLNNMEQIIALLYKIAGEDYTGSVKKTFYDISTIREQEKKKEKERIDRANRLNDLDLLRYFHNDDVEGYANGARYITKSGITAISKGELIIPSDKNPFNPDKDKVNRAQEIANEKKIIRDFAKHKTPWMNDAGTLDANGKPITQEEADQAAASVVLPEIIQSAANQASEKFNQGVESLTGKTIKSDGKLKDAIGDFKKNLAPYGGKMAAGGLAGAFSFGALFGGSTIPALPLLGAALGAGSSLVAASDKFKLWLFGVKEDGEFKDGIIPPNIVNWFAKNGKQLGGLSLGGAVAGGLLGHPLIGLLMGAGAGIVNSSEKFKDYMFGEEGVIKPATQKRIMKGLKTAAIGTIGANLFLPSVMGQLGFLPQVLLGTVGGFIASSDRFQEFIFGRKNDATGKYEHGLLPAIRKVTIDPLGRMMHGIEEKFVSFVKNDIVNPIRVFFEPIHRAKKKSLEFLKDSFNKIFEKAGTGLNDMFKTAFGPLLEKFKNSDLYKGISKVFGVGKKVIGTMINPLKWMQVAGKGMGNIVGALGGMNHLTNEEYEQKYGFFGHTLRRKGQNTIDTLENADLTKSEYKSLLGNLKTVNRSRSERLAQQKETAKELRNKIYDNLGGSESAIKAAQEYAKNSNLDSDEANNQLNMLTLEAYRQNYVGKNRRAATEEMNASGKTLNAMLRNMGTSEEMLPKAMKIIKGADIDNPEEMVKTLQSAGIRITGKKKDKFLKEAEYYKKQYGITKSHTVEEWEAMTPDQRLEAMKNDQSFNQENFANKFKETARKYQRDSLAVTDAGAMQDELNDKLQSMGINPSGLNSKQMQEILEAQYKNKLIHGTFRDEPEESDESSDSESGEERNEAIHDIHETLHEQTNQMIELLQKIADHFDNNESNIDRMQENHNKVQEAINNEAPDSQIENIIRSATGNDDIEDAGTIGDMRSIQNTKILSKRRFADLHLRTTGRYATSNPLVTTDEDTGELPESEQTTVGARVRRLLATPIRKGGMTEFKNRLSNVFHQPIESSGNEDEIESNAMGRGPKDYDALSAVSAGELIVDASKFGYNNKVDSSKIWSFAKGTPMMESIGLSPEQKEELDKQNKEEKENSARLLHTLERVSENTKQTRQALASDEEVKKNRGKVPSFLSNMMGKFGNVFSFAKLAKKAKFFAIGAGILLAPLLDKLLGAVVPFLTEKVLPAIAEALPGIIEKIGSLLPALVNMISTAVPKIVDVLANQVIPNLLKTLPTLLNGATDIITSLVKSLPNILKPLLDLLPTVVKNVFSEIIPSLLELLPQLIEVLSANLGDIISSLIEGLIASIGSIIQNLPSIIVNTVKGIGKAGFGLFKGLFGGSGLPKKLNIKTKTSHKIDANYEMPKKFIEDMNAAGRGKFTKNKGKKNYLSEAASGITSFFKNLFKSKKTETQDQTDENSTPQFETYSDGRSYLNGKQVNPIMVHISQNADKYKNRPFSIPLVDKGITLGTDGCGVMSGAMVINSLLGDDVVTPEKIADYALSTGGKAAGGGIKAGFFKPYFKKYGIDTSYHDLTDENNRPRETSNIVDALRKNRPVILMGKDLENSGKTPFPDNNHYVVATGISEDGSKVILNDPYSTTGGDVYDLNEVLDKTILGIEASKSGNGLNNNSITYTREAEENNTYGKIKNSATKLIVKPIQTNTPTQNLGKRFDPYAYQDLGKFNPITEDEINNFINFWCSKGGHTAFVGHGDIFLKASKETGLDPRYIVAHAATESGWGSSKICQEKGNYFGIAAYNDSPYESAKTFDGGLETGIVEGAKWIKRNYYDAGQKSIYDMIYADPNHRYAVFDDGSPNWEWINLITSIIRKAPNAYTDANSISGSGASNLYEADREITSYFKEGDTTLENNNYAELKNATHMFKKHILQDERYKNLDLNYAMSDSNNIMTSDDAINIIKRAYGQPLMYSDYLTNKDTGFSLRNYKDPKYDIIRYLYGNEFESNSSQVVSDLKGTDMIDSYKPYIDSVKEIYKRVMINERLRRDPNFDTNSEDFQTLLQDSADQFYRNADPIIASALNQMMVVTRAQDRAGTKLYNQKSIPYTWEDFPYEDVMLDGKKLSETEYSKLPNFDKMMRDLLYSPYSIYTTNIEEQAKYLSTMFGKTDTDKEDIYNRTVEFLTKVREKGFDLNPDQTELLYKSPVALKSGKIVKFAPYGSDNFNKNAPESLMKMFKNVIRPDQSSLNQLDQQDSELYRLITENGGIRQNVDKLAEYTNIGTINDSTISDDRRKKNDAVNKAAEDSQETINGIFDSYETGEETSNGDKEPFSLINFLRGIGTFFSSVFDRIADIIFGGGTWGNTEDWGVNSHTSGNNIYGHEPKLSDATTIIVKRRPDEYASSEVKKNSECIKAYLNMNHPNGTSPYAGKWVVDVCGRMSGTDDYFLLDGYTIKVPRSDIVSGYDYVQEIDTNASSSNIEKTLTTLDIIGRPDQYGDVNTSDILKKIAGRNIPDTLNNGGLWKLKVTGKDGNDGYYLEDGTKVVIPRDKIHNYSMVDNIPVYKPIGNTGKSIYDLISSATTSTASDDFFTKSFISQGYNGYKTSNGPDMDTMNAYRVHSGIDYATGGTNPLIYSPISGTVTRDNPGSGTGNYLVIKEDGKTDGTQRYHRFMHMLDGSPFVKTGDHVEQGDLIGQVGNTGASYGEHLHYDIADEAGLQGSLNRDYVKAHFVEPNQYLDKYFKKHNFDGAKVHETTNSGNKSNSIGLPSGKGGDHDAVKGINDIYEAIIEIISYLAKITTNTGLIGDIVTLLTSLDSISSNKNLSEEQKAKKSAVARETLKDKVRQLSMTLNSSNNETTGHSSMVEAMQFIASM